MTFTIGAGNDICVLAEKDLAHLVIGQTLESITKNMGQFWRHFTNGSQLRWLGPEKGVIHVATAAIVKFMLPFATRSVDQENSRSGLAMTLPD